MIPWKPADDILADIQEKARESADLRQALVEKDQMIEEKDQVIGEKDHLIADLKRRLSRG